MEEIANVVAASLKAERLKALRLWRLYQRQWSESKLNLWLHMRSTIKASSWHLQAISEEVKTKNWNFDFQSTWLSYRRIPLRKYAESSRTHIQPVVKLQWLNLCGWKRLQSFSLRPTAISGFGFAFKTTASNQKIQSISIKQDHTVIRKVMTFLEIICVLMRGQYNYHCSSSASW